MRKTVHMALDVEGALRNYPTAAAFERAFKNCVTDDQGRKVPPLEFREQLWKLHGEGVKVIPMGDCDGFDPITGCPGHPMPDEDHPAGLAPSLSHKA